MLCGTPVARSTVFNCAVGPCISLPPSPRVLCAAAARLDAVHLHRLPRSFYAWSVCFLSQNVTCGGRVGWAERGSCRQGTQARMETAADAPVAAEPPATAVVCRAAFPAFAILAWHGQERADIFYTTTLPGTSRQDDRKRKREEKKAAKKAQKALKAERAEEKKKTLPWLVLPQSPARARPCPNARLNSRLHARLRCVDSRI